MINQITFKSDAVSCDWRCPVWQDLIGQIAFSWRHALAAGRPVHTRKSWLTYAPGLRNVKTELYQRLGSVSELLNSAQDERGGLRREGIPSSQTIRHYPLARGHNALPLPLPSP